MYNNLFDAFVKTYADETGLSSGNWLGKTRARLARFYSGVSIYGGTYIGFIALEFSLYETALRKIETECDSRSLLQHCFSEVKTLRVVHDAFIQVVKIFTDGADN